MTGGRWNSKGTPVVYASTSIALAVLETLVHTGANIAVPNSFLVRMDVPADTWKLREKVTQAQLEPTWLAEPSGSATLELGTEWLKSTNSPLLLVPSVIVPEEYNALVNPAHPDAALIRARITRQFVYDPRLAKPR